MNICLFSPNEINSPLQIKDERAQHLIKVLHKKIGETFTAGVIGGQSGVAKITEITAENLFFTFEPLGNGKLLKPLKMIIGFPRPIQLKRLLRDIAALGVSEVHLTGTELGEKSYMQSNLLERGTAYKMLLDGTVQAGSTHVPELFMHQTLSECLDCVSGNLLIALDNINPKCSLTEVFENETIGGDKAFAGDENSIKEYTVVAAIGSERGWTDKERKLLESKGYVRCGMGERIMRTETAATVAGSIILSKTGYLYK